MSNDNRYGIPFVDKYGCYSGGTRSVSKEEFLDYHRQLGTPAWKVLQQLEEQNKKK